MTTTKVKKIIKNIKNVKIQGAREVAKAGLNALKIEAKKNKSKTGKEFISDIEKTAMSLTKTRPTEPGLRHMVLKVLNQIRKSDTKKVSKLKKIVKKSVKDSLDELDSALQKIASNGAGLIKQDDVIMTHCHSHSVVEILREAKKQGKEFKVIVTETRPLYQGIKTAKDLLKSKIKVVYAEDSAMGYFMKDVTKVLVGCDAILPDGSIVNKIGTLPMAIVAREFGKPVHVAGGSIKVTKEVDLEMRKASEIIEPKKLPGAKIVNPAFDVTPSDFIESIVTEKAVIKPGMVRQVVMD